MNLVIGDVLELKIVDISRKEWPVAIVNTTKSDSNRLVQSVYLRIGYWQGRKKAKGHLGVNNQ